MKTWIKTVLCLIGFLFLNKVSEAQDYKDIGRTKYEEFEILKFNGYKISKIESYEDGIDAYLARRPEANAQYDNIIQIDRSTQLVVRVIWNFNHKNFQFIKSLLSDMNPVDSTYSVLVKGNGKAQLTNDQRHPGYGFVVWNKKF